MVPEDLIIIDETKEPIIFEVTANETINATFVPDSGTDSNMANPVQ